MPSDDSTRRSAAGNDPQDKATGSSSASDSQDERVDFGAFVSSRVRASADKLKGTAETPPRTGGSTPAAGTRGAPQVPATAKRQPNTGKTPGNPTVPADASPAREKPSRYWRDSAGRPGTRPSRASDTDGGEQLDPESDESRDSDGGGAGIVIQNWFHDNSEGRPWFLPACIAAAVVALLLVIFLLTRLGGGGGDTPETPIPTSQSVLESSTETVTEPEQVDTQPAVQPTETPRTGGDNQRNNPQDGSPGANVGDGELALGATPSTVGRVASACPQECLIRVREPADSKVLTDAKARPSYSLNGWSWVVAPPDIIRKIEAATTDVELVKPDAETLRLYAVQLPSDVSSDEDVSAFGTILDSVDDVRIVETESVPAPAGQLVDRGYIVGKVTPGPVYGTQQTSDKPTLASTDIGTLAPAVSSENIQRTVEDMQGMGSTDGSGVGSRYYSLTGNQLAADYLFRALDSYGVKVWYEDFITPDGLLLVNIVGELPGSDPSKIYGVMAHMDTTSSIPGQSPGADDNATGVASGLEIMRILSGYRLTHPARVIFTNAEDSGLLGSDAWAKRAVREKVPIEGVFNIDSIGSARQGNAIILNGDAKSAWMSDLMVRVNDGYGLGNAVWPSQNPGIVADDNYVRAQGIESIMIARELYGQSAYHHTPNDLIEHMSISQVVSATNVVLISIAALAQ